MVFCPNDSLWVSYCVISSALFSRTAARDEATAVALEMDDRYGVI